MLATEDTSLDSIMMTHTSFVSNFIQSKSTTSATTADAERRPSLYNTAKEGGPSCPICGKRFPWTSSVERHLRTHTGERPFTCPKCDYKSSQKGTLMRHIATIHPEYNVQQLSDQPMSS